MSMDQVERLLAELYTDAALRQTFLLDPLGVLSGRGLNGEETQAFLSLDPTGLELAGRSFDRKRQGRRVMGGPVRRFFGRWF